jgi:hypothetical protein
MRALLVSVLLLSTTLPIAVAEETPMGRLFFTPSERNTLEELRRRAQAPKAPEAERRVGVIKPHATVRFSGMIKRSDGVSAIWVNGKQYYGNERPDDISLSAQGSNDTISVKLPENGRRISLRVGQDMDATSGTVAERYTLREAAAPVKAPKKDGASPEQVVRAKAASEKKNGRTDKKSEDDDTARTPAESE